MSQRGAESVVEVRAGLSDLASAMVKIDGEETTDEVYGMLLQYHECWQKLGVDDPGFSESEKIAITMITFGGFLTQPYGFDQLAEAVQRCEGM